MPLVMPTRTESAVYFDLDVDVTRTTAFLAARNAQAGGPPATLFHVVLWAFARALARRPWLNRFVAGGRLWDRDGVWLSFAAKRARADDAPLVTLKRRFDPAWTLDDVVAAVAGDVRTGRAGPTAAEREQRLLAALPRWVLRLAYALFRRLDAWGLAPGRLLALDPLYTSAFLANLGSVGLDAAYHHLYEHGTASLFCVVGQAREVGTDAGGSPRRVVRLRFSFDERVADGLYAQRALELLRRTIEDPAAPPEA